MSEEVDERDRELLAVSQTGISPTKRPFKEIADKLGWEEEEVITRFRKLSESGHIRKFGAVLAPKKMGYISLLAAIEVPEGEIDQAAEFINSFPGVTHNYVRDTTPNVWFTMTEADKPTLESNLIKIEEMIGSSVVRLPMSRLFKIGVKLDIRT